MLIFLIFLSSIILGGEVDPTLVWGHSLKDATKELNWYFNYEMRVALQKLPDDCDCQTASSVVMRHFGVTLNSPMEKWVKASTSIDKFPSLDDDLNELFKKSIYWKEGNKVFEKMQLFSLDEMIDETINVGGIYFSVDKLSHFTGSGYLYHKSYRRSINKDKTNQSAMETAINLGIFGEKNVLGRFVTGVFSYADLEANFQGFLLAMDMCKGENPLLQKQKARWQLSRDFDISDYVNPFWNEAYNTSFYYEGQNLTLLPKSKTVLYNLPKTCVSFHSLEIQSRYAGYDKIAIPSFSVIYLRQLISIGDLPDPAPFNLRSICSMKNFD